MHIAQLCRANYLHITFLSILLVPLSTIMQGWMYSLTFFPFLSLNGIAGGTKQPWNHLNDPVLLSYWWCLLMPSLRLCVERMIPSTSSPGCPPPSHHNFPVASAIQHTTWSNGLSTLSGAKELWIGTVINLNTSLVLLYHTSSTWRVSMDHGAMVSPMNAGLCSSKPFTISLKGQFENSLLFFVIWWLWPTISNECTGGLLSKDFILFGQVVQP